MSKIAAIPLPSGMRVRLKRPTLKDYLDASRLVAGSSRWTLEEKLLQLIVEEIDGEARDYNANVDDWPLSPKDALALRAVVTRRLKTPGDMVDATAASARMKRTKSGLVHHVEIGGKDVAFGPPTMRAQLTAVQTGTVLESALLLIQTVDGEPVDPEDALSLQEALLFADVVHVIHYASAEDVEAVGNALDALWSDEATA